MDEPEAFCGEKLLNESLDLLNLSADLLVNEGAVEPIELTLLVSMESTVLSSFNWKAEFTNGDK